MAFLTFLSRDLMDLLICLELGSDNMIFIKSSFHTLRQLYHHFFLHL